LESPEPFLAVARIVSAHGIHGEVRCEIITDFPERFRRTTQLYAGDQHVPLVVERVRLDKHRAILKLAGIDTRDAAERLRGQILSVPEAEAVKLPPGTYFWHDIVGMTVRTGAGDEVGVVEEILPTGGNDVYVVRTPAGEVLIPAIKDVVRGIDLVNGVMTVELIEGLVN